MKKIKVGHIGGSELSEGFETILYETKEELCEYGFDSVNSKYWENDFIVGVIKSSNGCPLLVSEDDKFTIIEDEVGQIGQLEQLDLKYEIEDEVGQIGQLEQLDLKYEIEDLPEKWILRVDKITPSIERYLIDKYGEVDGYIKRNYKNETFSLFSPSDYYCSSPNYVTQNEELIETYLHDYTPITLQEFNKACGLEEEKKELPLSSIEEKLDEMNTVFDHIIKLGNDKLQKTVKVNELLGEIKGIDSSIEEQKVSIEEIKNWFSINGIKVD